MGNPLEAEFEELFREISVLRLDLVPGSLPYSHLQARARDLFNESAFANSGEGWLPGFGGLQLPFQRMGNISSLDLFGLDELILFTFYLDSQKQYSKFADLGANIGLHSILAAMLGWEVSAYEPDDETVKIAEKNFEANRVAVAIHKVAVGTSYGRHTFTRVEHNLTGSHLSGRKEVVTGPFTNFEVTTVPFRDILLENDLLKIDVEGAEGELVCSTNEIDWAGTDALLEVGSERTAKEIFEHVKNWSSVRLFSQKTGWNQVTTYEDLPTHHTQGSVYISDSPSEQMSRT